MCVIKTKMLLSQENIKMSYSGRLLEQASGPGSLIGRQTKLHNLIT